MDRKDVVIAVVVRDGKVLICQRKDEDRFGGYWEFPGGKREPGETVEQCLQREMIEELALKVELTEPLTVIEHDYSTLCVRLVPYLCTCEGEPRAIACQRLAWVTPSELANYRFPQANESLLGQIVGRLAAGAGVAPGNRV